jgi:hypothetical protein
MLYDYNYLNFVPLTGLEPANRNVKGYRLDHFGFRGIGLSLDYCFRIHDANVKTFFNLSPIW